MIIVFGVAVVALSVPLLGGRFSHLVEIRLRRPAAEHWHRPATA